MANEPSLGELTSIKAEPSINPGVILDSRDAVHSLNQSAQFNAEMHQRKYEQGLKNLSALYQDIGSISETPMMQQDRPIVFDRLAKILSTIADDPRAALGGPKFAEIQKDLGQVRMMSTNSKQDNVYNDFNEKWLKQNPDLDTPANRQKLQQFGNSALGARQKFMLDTPVKFDPEVAMGNILKQKQVAVPYANTSFEGPNNEWMIRETGTTYGRDSALKMWNQGYATGTDANNQPIKKWAGEQFEKLKSDPAQMEKFGNPENTQQLYENLGKMMFGTEGDITGEKTSTRTANPYTMLDSRQRNSLWLEAVKEGNREKLAAIKKDLELKGAPENANFLLRQYASVVGNTTGEKHTVEVGKGNYKKEDVVDAGVLSSVLKNYAATKKETIKEGHSVDQVTETIVQGNQPDIITRTQDGNLRLTFWKHYDKTDKIPKGKHVGDVVLDSNGQNVLQTTGVIPKRELLATLGKGVVQTKLLASSIDAAAGALDKDPNTTMDQVNAGTYEGTTVQQAHQSQHTENKKTFSLNGKSYSMQQVEKAAKQSGMPVEEYIKKAGLK